MLALLIHGDAALRPGSGGGNAQPLAAPRLRTGGTVHFVINNQIGFTTDPRDARSTRYCTDVAKMIEAPIFHVNGDDPEAVCMVSQLALDFRVRWKRDVFIDMYCFRRHGHNETDEPSFTQPTLYRTIAAHPLVSAIYTEYLVGQGSITAGQGEAIRDEYSAALEENLTKAKEREAAKVAKRAPAGRTPFKGSTAQFQPEYHHTPVVTSVPADEIERIVRGLTTGARDLQGQFQDQAPAGRPRQGAPGRRPGGLGLRRGAGFRLAPGRGNPGAAERPGSCERGTFSHRHAVLCRHRDGREVRSARRILDPEAGARFCVY